MIELLALITEKQVETRLLCPKAESGTLLTTLNIVRKWPIDEGGRMDSAKMLQEEEAGPLKY